MLLRSAKVLVVIMLAATLGLHWALLQGIAWTTMLADNLQTFSLRNALVRTFDGNHPCSLCKAIADGKTSEKKDQLIPQTRQLEFPPAKDNPVLVAPSHFQLMPQVNSFAASLARKPPTPPPRAFPV